LGDLDGGSIRAIMDAAMVVAAADGTLSGDEIGEMAGSLSELTEGVLETDTTIELLNESFARYQDEGADTMIPAIAEVLDYNMQRIAFLMASAAAWTRSGVQTAEGLVLQKMKAAFGMEDNEYFELLGEGKGLSDG